VQLAPGDANDAPTGGLEESVARAIALEGRSVE
jgi:hypothetical protein